MQRVFVVVADSLNEFAADCDIVLKFDSMSLLVRCDGENNAISYITNANHRPTISLHIPHSGPSYFPFQSARSLLDLQQSPDFSNMSFHRHRFEDSRVRLPHERGLNHPCSLRR